MPKDRVTANSTERVTRGRHYNDPSLASPDSAISGQARMSYLGGAHNGFGDYGYAMGGPIANSDWQAQWRKRRCLQKHTVDQGLSTWDHEDFPRA